jgi:hypothetical protein
VFSGFVATWKKWESLDADWQRLLRQNNIRALHFKDHRARHSMLKKFINLVKSEIEYGISVAVKVEDFDAMPSHIKALVGGDAFYLAFKCVVLRIVKNVMTEPGSILSFTCDEDQETVLPCYRWYKQIKMQMEDVRTKLVSFCVADDAYFSQLQAADLMAALTRCEAERKMMGTTSDVQPLFDHLALPEVNRSLVFQSAFLDQSNLKYLIENINDEILSPDDSDTIET